MKKTFTRRLVATATFCLAFNLINAQWAPQNSGLLWQTVRGMHFVDPSNGFGVGDNGTLIKTIDGGANWTIENPGTMSLINSVFFQNTSTGWITTSTAEIKKSIDGGVNWTVKKSIPTVQLQDVIFLNTTTGFAVGGEGGICSLLKTTDGGNNWYQQTPNFSGWLWAVNFPSANIGYTVGIAGGILKSIDGGSNWNVQTSNSSEWLRDVFFIDDLTGWVVGDNSEILKTINGGTTWTPQTSSNPGNFTNVHFIDANTGFIVGADGNNAVIMKTINGGATWTSNLSTIYPALQSLAFATNSIAYTGGLIGTVLKNSSVLGIDKLIASQYSVTVYPNPCSEYLHLNIESKNNIQNAAIIIYDLSGKEIYRRKNIHNGKLSIEMKELPSGSYYYSIENNGVIVANGGLVIV